MSGAPGKGEASRGLLLHHQAKSLDSQYQIYAEITCDQARLDDAARAPAEIARVLRSCLTHSQPVYIELPRDMVTVPCEPVVPPPPPRMTTATRSRRASDEILARLARPRSPVLMVGVEVRRFGLEDKVAELARRLGLPVVTSFLGPRPARRRRCAAARHLPGRGRRAGDHRAGRGLRCAVPARRDHLRHQLRRVGASRSTCARRSRRSTARDARAITSIREIPLARAGRCAARAPRAARRSPTFVRAACTRAASSPTTRRSPRTTSPARSTI